MLGSVVKWGSGLSYTLRHAGKSDIIYGDIETREAGNEGGRNGKMM